MASVPWIQVQAAIDNQHKRCRNLSSGSESDSQTGLANLPEMTGTSPIASPSYMQRLADVFKSNFKDASQEKENSPYSIHGGRIFTRKY